MSRAWMVGLVALLGCGPGPDGAADDGQTGGTESVATGGATTMAGTTGPSATTSATGSGGGSDSGSAATSATSAVDASTGDDTSDAETGDTPTDPRQVMLETYAPRIWFTADEAYWPSTAEWAFAGLERFADAEGRHWVQTIDQLASPSDTIPLFAGDLSGASLYGYWADKGEGVVDLVYFVFYPYNRGKSVLNTVWGNHVGDWEHITVRLLEQPDGELTPSEVYLSAHSFGGAYPWGSGEVALFDGTHPVVYSAWGSHGFWAEPGSHAYVSIGRTDPVFDICLTLVCVDLVDETAAGVAWDSWEDVHGMDFFEQQGLEGMPWPVWMSDAFTDAGAGDPTVPGMGPVYRWGNPEDCSVLGIPIDITDLIGVCRLEDGPTGPVSKGTWGPQLR